MDVLQNCPGGAYLFEKLLLHILIVLFPIMFYNFMSDKNKKTFFGSSYVCGLLQGASAVLCMAFPLHIYGFDWDLRYVPMILSFLYAGPLAGGMVVAAILGCRIIIGGQTMIFGFAECLLSAVVPLLLARRFWTYNSTTRQLITAGAAAAVGLLSLLIVYLVMLVQRPVTPFDSGALWNLLIIGGIHIGGTWLASYMNEQTVERSMMRQKIQQAEKLNILHELAASVAHEIRNPLTVVKGFIQLIEERKGQQSEQYTQLILSELGRAESIINDYLNFAKPEMKKVELLPLARVVDETVLLLNAYAVQSGVSLRTELGEQITVLADKGQLKQALVNLLKNGIEATPTGGTVCVSISQANRMAQVIISDSGKGMSKDELGRLGTLFYTTKDKGTGLGTMVSMRIVDSMGGRISFSSTPGVGTKVIVSLPLNTNP